MQQPTTPIWGQVLFALIGPAAVAGIIWLVNTGLASGASGGVMTVRAKGLACALGLTEANKTYAAVGRAEAAWPTLQAAASAHGISPALLAAIGVRETAFEDVNQIGGGNGVGVFQLTVAPGSGISAAEANNLGWAASEAARQLAEHQRYAERRFPWFTAQEIVQATADLYNFGPGRYGQNISGNPAMIDAGSKQNNYGLSVYEMMSCFE